MRTHASLPSTASEHRGGRGEAARMRTKRPGGQPPRSIRIIFILRGAAWFARFDWSMEGLIGARAWASSRVVRLAFFPTDLSFMTESEDLKQRMGREERNGSTP